MKIVALSLTLVMAAIPVSASATSPPAWNASTVSEKRFQSIVRQLLEDYSRKDVGAVLQMLDEKPVMMGTDLVEVASSKDTVAKLLTDDFNGWDSSEFGPFKDFFVQQTGGMASVLCDVPWTAQSHGHKTIFVIRLATMWHRVNGRWRLAHMLNAVASTRPSARPDRSQ